MQDLTVFLQSKFDKFKTVSFEFFYYTNSVVRVVKYAFFFFLITVQVFVIFKELLKTFLVLFSPPSMNIFPLEDRRDLKLSDYTNIFLHGSGY